MPSDPVRDPKPGIAVALALLVGWVPLGLLAPYVYVGAPLRGLLMVLLQLLAVIVGAAIAFGITFAIAANDPHQNAAWGFVTFFTIPAGALLGLLAVAAGCAFDVARRSRMQR